MEIALNARVSCNGRTDNSAGAAEAASASLNGRRATERRLRAFDAPEQCGRPSQEDAFGTRVYHLVRARTAVGEVC